MKVGCFFRWFEWRVGGKSGKPERLLQEEEKRKKRGSKQVGVKSGKIGRLLQEEEKRKQAGRSKGWKNQKLAPSGRKEEASRLREKVEK